MGKLRRALTLFLMAGFGLVLSGCGGEDAFLTPPEGGGADPKASSVASVILTSSTPTLGSSSSDGVDLVALVKDANSALVEGQDVVFSASGGGLQITSGTTNAAGEATARLSTAGDPTNRDITVTARVGTRSDSVNVAVTGTGISVSGESAVVFGSTIDLTIFLQDSASNGIPNKAVTVSSAKGNALSQATLNTGASGSAQVTLTGSVGGVDTITVSALGVMAQYTVNVSSDQFDLSLPSADLVINMDHTITVVWSQNGSPVNGQTVHFTTTRGTLSSSTATTLGGQASVTVRSNNAGPVRVTAFVGGDGGPTAKAEADFVATTPATLTLQADLATIGPNGEEDTIKAVVRDNNNNRVKNIPIRFTIVQDNSNGAISNSSDLTDSLGRASTVYTSTDVTTAKDGVVIQAEVENRATYEGVGVPCEDTFQGGINQNDGSKLCTTVAITVAQADLFVRLGGGNLIEELDATRYSMPYSVVVTDSAGNARAGVEVIISLIPVSYGKGWYRLGVGEDGLPNTDDDEAPWRAVWQATCQNEDTLNEDPDALLNGFIDADEDINGNGRLEPGNVAAVQGKPTTDATGFATFDIIYAKDFSLWTRYQLRASAQVAGSEGVHEVEFSLPALAKDFSNKEISPPGNPSPFGIANLCTNPD